MAADEYRDGPPRTWVVSLRLAIEADDTNKARAVSNEALQKMEVVAGAEPLMFQSVRLRPCWNVISELDLSGLESITPDDAPTRFKYVIRKLPDLGFIGEGDLHRGMWEWLVDSWLSIRNNERFPHPGVRAATIIISDRPDDRILPYFFLPHFLRLRERSGIGNQLPPKP